MQGNIVPDDSEHMPSPNLYSPQKPFRSYGKVAFTKSLRKTFFDTKIEKSPGPGQYETNLSRDHSFSSLSNDGKNQTFSSRFVAKEESKPGPGAYDIKNDFKKTLPSFSIRKRTQTFQEL